MEKKISPYALILLSFLLLIIIGGIILFLPISHEYGKNISFFEAIFTATSAVTVTGLVINDVSTVFSTFGKTIILILIQLGGLGILTFSSLIILLLYNKIGYNTKKVVKEDLNFDDNFDLYKYLKRIVVVVFSIEILGAVILFFSFIRKFSLGKAIFYSIFHSISAFCNAGFTLFSNNLEDFTYSPIINFTIMLLIILGGLGFAAIIEIYEYLKGNIKKLSINTKLVLIVTLFLLVIPTVIFFIIEFNNEIFVGNGFFQKILVSFFNSVTTRTAGFNTIGLTSLKSTSIIIMIILMFIGTSPGSTGGGLKTTTIGVIILGVYSSIKNEEDIVFDRRRISYQSFRKAIAIFFIEIVYICVCIVLMSLFDSDKSVMKLLFELVSALGTVGLSLNLTESLSIYSKIILIITMFLGRVGTLTALYVFSKKNKIGKYRYSEESILIG